MALDERFSGPFLKLYLHWYSLDLRMRYRIIACCCRGRKVLLSSPFLPSNGHLHSLLDFSQSYFKSLTLPFGRMGEKRGTWLNQLKYIVGRTQRAQIYTKAFLRKCAWKLSHPHVANGLKLHEPLPITKNTFLDSFY